MEVVIISEVNSLMPQPTEVARFGWDENLYDYSEEAFLHIQRLMSQQRALSVATTESSRIKTARCNVVFANR